MLTTVQETLAESRQGKRIEGARWKALPPEVCFICYETLVENRPGMAMDSCGLGSVEGAGESTCCTKTIADSCVPNSIVRKG